MKTVQKFTPEYLKDCKKMKPAQIIEFLESFRLLQEEKSLTGKSKLISLKVPVPLLNAFKANCQKNRVKYQTQIKALMTEWVRKS